MTAMHDFDRLVASWLESDAPADVREDLVAESLGTARGIGQRRGVRAWLTGPSPWPALGRRVGLGSMPPALRVAIVVGLLAAATIGAVLVGARLLRQTAPAPLVYSGILESSGNLSTPRGASIAVSLSDGRILVGGDGAADGSLAEVVDPGTGRSDSIRLAETNVALIGASTLPDGRVLLIAWIYGEPASSGRSSGLLFDPSTGAVRPTGPMAADRFASAMATMADGRVLIAGGLSNQETGEGLASAEIYDPATNAFSLTGSMTAPRIEHALTPLDDGTVLVTGGSRQERYDPARGTFAPAGNGLKSGRPPYLAPIRLPDGRILMIATGYELRCGRHGIEPISAGFFDPATGAVTEAPTLPHAVATATLLQDGRVLVSGHWQAMRNGCVGGGSYVTDDWIGVYDPASGVTLTSLDPFTGTGTLAADTDRQYASAVRLPDGRVALIGGDNGDAAEGGRNAIDIFR